MDDGPTMTRKANGIVYLQLTSLDGFVEELKRRGIGEARLSEWIQRRGVFERRKLRLTALDRRAGLIHLLPQLPNRTRAREGEVHSG